MKKQILLILAVCVLLMLCGCAAEVKTVPFQVEEKAETQKFELAQAYELRNVFPDENGALKQQFGFDGDDMLLGTSRDARTNLEKLFTVDAKTGISQQIMQTRYGVVEQVEILMDGEAVVYTVRGEKNGEFTGYRLYLRKESDGKILRLDEWLAGSSTEMILAKKLSQQGEEISYVWNRDGQYWLSCVNVNTLERRFYFLDDIIPEFIGDPMHIKNLYQLSDGEIGGSVMLSAKEYYWQAELPAERNAGEGWANAARMVEGVFTEVLMAGEWAIENVKIVEIDQTRSLQAGRYLYYLTARNELYRMDPKSRESLRLAEGVGKFAVSGDEKTVVYTTEKNGAVLLYADRIGEFYPTLINVSKEVTELTLNQDGSKIALSYAAENEGNLRRADTAVFDIVYSYGK